MTTIPQRHRETDGQLALAIGPYRAPGYALPGKNAAGLNGIVYTEKLPSTSNVCRSYVRHSSLSASWYHLDRFIAHITTAFSGSSDHNAIRRNFGQIN